MQNLSLERLIVGPREGPEVNFTEIEYLRAHKLGQPSLRTIPKVWLKLYKV